MLVNNSCLRRPRRAARGREKGPIGSGGECCTHFLRQILLAIWFAKQKIVLRYQTVRAKRSLRKSRGEQNLQPGPNLRSGLRKLPTIQPPWHDHIRQQEVDVAVAAKDLESALSIRRLDDRIP